MKKLIIVGAGGLGREVFSWAEAAAGGQGEWSVAGFLDDNPNALSGFEYPRRVLGGIAQHQPAEDEVFAMGLADPKTKMQLAAALERRGARFINIIHPSVILARNVKIGRGCVLCPHVVVTCDATIGNYVTLNLAASIGHDAVIGDGCTINSHADVMGHALESCVFLGSHAAVLPKIVVGVNAKVGAGSVALFRVRPEDTVLGVPAKILAF